MSDTLVAPAAPASPSPRRRLRIIAAIVSVALVIVAAWTWWQLDPPGKSGAEVVVDVQPGWGNAEIGNALADAGVISSPTVFRVYVKATSAGPFRAGRYHLHEHSGVRPAVHALDDGPEFVYDELRAPPGLTLNEIAARVGELPNRSAEKFLAVANSGAVRSAHQPPTTTSLEGLTWPDTYFVEPQADETEILRRMVNAFDKHATAAGIEDAPDVGLTPYEAVIVASLIQTEAGVAEDRPLISAVIRNRLDAGQPLQIDATVLYARGGGDGPITVTDLQRSSPYNTYVVTGLVPTPISTVTTEALKAALAPADVPYRYYVLADRSGKHAFAVTLEEHERNVAAAREKGLL